MNHVFCKRPNVGCDEYELASLSIRDLRICLQLHQLVFSLGLMEVFADVVPYDRLFAIKGRNAYTAAMLSCHLC